MSYKPRYDKTDWKALCDSCGRIFKASVLRKRWDGLMVCPDDWEPRQPQDFVRGVADTQAPMWTRPEASDTYASFACSTRTSIAAYAIAGCMIAGNSIDPGGAPRGQQTPAETHYASIADYAIADYAICNIL